MPCGLTEVAAVREPGGICSDAYEAPTSPRSPNFAEEPLIAAPLRKPRIPGRILRLFFITIVFN